MLFQNPQIPTTIPALPAPIDPALPPTYMTELLRDLGATQVDDKHMSDQDRARRWQAVVDALVATVPTQMSEAILTAQLLAAHTAAMDTFRRSMATFMDENARARLRIAGSQLMRTCIATLREQERARARTAGPRRTRN